MASIEIHDSPYGRFMLRSNDDISQQITKDKFFDQHMQPVFDEYIKEGDVCVDVGANLGFYTVYFSKSVGKAGLVYALEPNIDIFYQLCGNLYLNNCHNVKALQIAAFSKKIKMDLSPKYYVKKTKTPLASGYREPRVNLDKCDNVGAVSLKPFDDGTIAAKRLDTIVPDDQRVSFVKIDAEGCDLHAMFGLEGIIKRCKPVFVFEYEMRLARTYKQTYEDYLKFIKNIGYDIAKIGGNRSSDYICRPV